MDQTAADQTAALGGSGLEQSAPDMGQTFAPAVDPGHDVSPEIDRSEPEVTPAPAIDPDAPSYEQSAPDMGAEFEAAKEPSREEYLAQRALESGLVEREQENTRIATQAELDQRIEQRATPEPAYELNMDGSIGVSSRKAAEAENEREIYHLQRQLDAVRNEPTREFNHQR